MASRVVDLTNDESSSEDAPLSALVSVARKPPQQQPKSVLGAIARANGGASAAKAADAQSSSDSTSSWSSLSGDSSSSSSSSSSEESAPNKRIGKREILEQKRAALESQLEQETDSKVIEAVKKRIAAVDKQIADIEARLYLDALESEGADGESVDDEDLDGKKKKRPPTFEEEIGELSASGDLEEVEEQRRFVSKNTKNARNVSQVRYDNASESEHDDEAASVAGEYDGRITEDPSATNPDREAARKLLERGKFEEIDEEEKLDESRARDPTFTGYTLGTTYEVRYDDNDRPDSVIIRRPNRAEPITVVAGRHAAWEDVLETAKKFLGEDPVKFLRQKAVQAFRKSSTPNASAAAEKAFRAELLRQKRNGGKSDINAAWEAVADKADQRKHSFYESLKRAEQHIAKIAKKEARPAKRLRKKAPAESSSEE